jgi:hypothetical protein
MGVQINSAVEFGGRGVILHSDHSLQAPRGARLNTIGYAGKCSLHFPARRPNDNQKPTGLNRGYQVVAADKLGKGLRQV